MQSVGKSHVDDCAGFGNTFWRNVLLISLGTAAALKLAPVAGDDVYLTRWMAMYATPGSYWMAMNAKHTIQQEQVARGEHAAERCIASGGAPFQIPSVSDLPAGRGR